MPCYSNLFHNLLAVARICKITSINDMNEEGAVNFWAPAVRSKFDGTTGGGACDFPVYCIGRSPIACCI